MTKKRKDQASFKCSTTRSQRLRVQESLKEMSIRVALASGPKTLRAFEKEKLNATQWKS